MLAAILIYCVSFVASASRLVPLGKSTEEYIANGLEKLKLSEKISYEERQRLVERRLDRRAKEEAITGSMTVFRAIENLDSSVVLDAVQLEDHLASAIGTFKVDRTFACNLIDSSVLSKASNLKRYLIAKDGGHKNILGCLQLFPLQEWPDMFRAHVYLAETYKSAWYDRDHWFKLWQQADFQKYSEAACAANNPKFLSEMQYIPRNPKKYIPPLQLPYALEHMETIAIHDAVQTVEFFIERGFKISHLNAHRGLFQTFCSLEILQYLQDNGIPFSFKDIEEAIKQDSTEYLKCALDTVSVSVDEQLELVVKHSSVRCFQFLVSTQNDPATDFLANWFSESRGPLPSVLFKLLDWEATQEQIDTIAKKGRLGLLENLCEHLNMAPSVEAYLEAVINGNQKVVDFIKRVRPHYPTVRLK
ncbi:hypothetical protein PSACC_03046 [Paramicrosporidium saccamoebae]|uniref:Uncharacterized protein n=1 Tax=Paramicrosporidium saccamoebae TaxID=1246581 RepID=A0A2H9THF6_9FUNG|nr:hypothetical protein PSACC_03046 [Paramicrosporidium saccamoebae]